MVPGICFWRSFTPFPCDLHTDGLYIFRPGSPMNGAQVPYTIAWYFCSSTESTPCALLYLLQNPCFSCLQYPRQLRRGSQNQNKNKYPRKTSRGATITTCAASSHDRRCDHNKRCTHNKRCAHNKSIFPSSNITPTATGGKGFGTNLQFLGQAIFQATIYLR